MENARVLTDGLRFPEGPPLPSLKNGALIKQSNGPLYVIRNGQRVWLRNGDEEIGRAHV